MVWFILGIIVSIAFDVYYIFKKDSKRTLKHFLKMLYYSFIIALILSIIIGAILPQKRIVETFDTSFSETYFIRSVKIDGKQFYRIEDTKKGIKTPLVSADDFKFTILTKILE